MEVDRRREQASTENNQKSVFTLCHARFAQPTYAQATRNTHSKLHKMKINFKVLDRGERSRAAPPGTVNLIPSNWDDYSFKTSFEVVYCSVDGEQANLGTIKIGYVDQTHGWTFDKIPKEFENLPRGWFSLGQDVDYYREIHKSLSSEISNQLLEGLGDIVANNDLFTEARNEKVLSDSLMRGVSLSAIKGQFSRVLKGQIELTEFEFSYRDPGDDKHAAISLDFHVEPASKPPTNVHVLIGRNGVGKTTLLNNMVRAIVPSAPKPETGGRFFGSDYWIAKAPLPTDYFSSVVSVSFSAFDPFVPPADQPDRSSGVAYFYIGMKKDRSDNNESAIQSPKTDTDLANDFIESLQSCLSQPSKRERWVAAIRRLESDSNFAEMDLGQLADLKEDELTQAARSYTRRMSSGHSIVLLTITKLVDTVEEKTLVLIDEPESHLHPPLLSAFARALSELLHNRNGVAIIATHSPVVVQEVPQSCVWKLTRSRNQGRSDRPERQTFGENVGVLTREIFGLEVSKSGYHEMIQQSVTRGGDFESIIQEYNNQLGSEAQGILRALINIRDSAKAGSE